ncbi:MAG: hypothetical protein ABII64_01710 [Elusimicrobiota bacterium]
MKKPIRKRIASMNKPINFYLPSSFCRNPRGQVLPYALVMLLVLIMCWAMMLNIAKLTADRMITQNAADNAAVSAAVYRARALNTLGLMNNAIGALLYGGNDAVTSFCWTYHKYCVSVGLTGLPAGAAIPLFPMGGLNPGDLPGEYAEDNQKKVAGYFDTYGSNDHLQVRLIKTAVEQLSKTQQLIAKTIYPVKVRLLANDIGKRQEKNRAGEYSGADLTYIARGTSLGLKTNTNGPEYHRSKKLGWPESFLIKGAINTLIALTGTPVEIKEIYQAERWSSGNSSWLYADKEEFDKNHKITVICERQEKGYPLLAGWFGIKWPSIKTIAAAGTYNTAGPMFPVETNEKPSDAISPVIREYQKAEDHGWDAHLAPVKQMGILH